MKALDLTILFAYLIGTVLFGAYFSKSQKNVKDYFVGGGRVPWWAVAGSIVATETSTVTFISVPGFAYNTNFTFMQLVIGYMIGRIVVTVFFVPLYFRGQLLTVYQLLGQRFGSKVRRLASALFLVTRSLADGFRLFATGLVLAALLLAMPGMKDLAQSWFPSLNPTLTILILSAFVLGLATILYTFLGGMEAVIWTDVIQLMVYLMGAALAAWVLLDKIPGGWSEVVTKGTAAGKFDWFDFTMSLNKSYSFWAGIIGGAFLTTATHGTDQLMVQRYLCSDTPLYARLALLSSGVVVFFQFLLFLVIGAMLYVFYTGYATSEMAAFMLNGKVQADRIFPHFIVTHLPAGVVGLVMAAIFAAAMSTLSSSLNSSSATAMADFYMPLTKYAHADDHYLFVSRMLTIVWGVIQITVAIVAIKLSDSVVNEVLGIASFTNGVILGLFFLGTFTKRVQQTSALVGLIAGASVMLAVKLFTGISWQWYVLIGSVVTFVAGVIVSYFVPEEARAEVVS